MFAWSSGVPLCGGPPIAIRAALSVQTWTFLPEPWGPKHDPPRQRTTLIEWAFTVPSPSTRPLAAKASADGLVQDFPVLPPAMTSSGPSWDLASTSQPEFFQRTSPATPCGVLLGTDAGEALVGSNQSLDLGPPPSLRKEGGRRSRRPLR